MVDEDATGHVAAEKRVLRQSEQVAFPSHRDGSPGGLGIVAGEHASIAERNVPITVNHTAISISPSGVSKIFDETGVGPYGYCPCFCRIFQSILSDKHCAPSSSVVGTENKVTGKNGIRSYSYRTGKKVIIKYSTPAGLRIRENIIPVEFRMISYDDISPPTPNRTSVIIRRHINTAVIISPEQGVVSYHHV